MERPVSGQLVGTAGVSARLGGVVRGIEASEQRITRQALGARQHALEEMADLGLRVLAARAQRGLYP